MKFVRRPSVRPCVVCVAIISEPKVPISFKFYLCLPLGHKLGLLFSKFFSSALLCHQSSENRNSSVVIPLSVRPSVSQLSLYLMCGFQSNFSCCFTGPDAGTLFEFLNFGHDFFFCSVKTFLNGSKKFNTLPFLQSPPKVFKILLNIIFSMVFT